MADMNLKAMLTKKLGPLPAWGWGLVIGGGYLGYRVLSGKGISMTGSDTPVEQVPAYEDGGAYSGPGSSGGDNGGVPSITIINQIPDTDSSDLADQLAKSRAYGRKMKRRGDNWANWGRKWKDIAKRRKSKTGASNIARGSDKPKRRNTGASRRTGTQGTYMRPPRRKSPVRRGFGTHMPTTGGSGVQRRKWEPPKNNRGYI